MAFLCKVGLHKFEQQDLLALYTSGIGGLRPVGIEATFKCKHCPKTIDIATFLPKRTG